MKNNNIKNYILLCISIFFYIYLMFFSNIDMRTGKKELENILILAIPCFIYFYQSLLTKNKQTRKKYLIFYLILYILAVLGFVFSNFRMSWTHLGNVTNVREYNLIPFQGINTLLSSPLGLSMALYNIIGNLLMLSPLAILLPLINDKFKKPINFIITILLITTFIEVTQVLTNCGSFDIDDIILNFMGSFILYLITKIKKISELIYKFFYELNINKPFMKYIKILLLVALTLTYIEYTITIYQNYLDNKIDTSNLKCINNNKTYITTIGKYNYYSECEYSGYIKRGQIDQVEIKDYLNKNLTDDELNKLKIVKEEWIKNVDIEYNDNKIKLIDDTKNVKLYTLGIEKIIISTIDNKEIIIEDTISNEEFNYLSLVDLTEMSSTYTIFEGEYYNVVGCSSQLSIESDDYIIPKQYEYDSNFCVSINNLK